MTANETTTETIDRNDTIDRSSELQIEGNFEQFKGKAREEWGELTDQELEQARGNWEQFVGTVKEKTGEAAETIERKYNEWMS